MMPSSPASNGLDTIDYNAYLPMLFIQNRPAERITDATGAVPILRR